MAVQRRPAQGTDKRGRVKWVVRWYEDGKQYSKSFDTRTAANAFDAEVTTQVRKGVRSSSNSLTVLDMFTAWVNRPTVTRQATKDSYTHTLTDLHPLYGKKIQDVRPQDIENLYKVLTVTGRPWRGYSTLSPRTATEHVSRLSACYEWAIKRQEAEYNPVKAADVPRLGEVISSKGEVKYSRDQYEKLAQVLERGGYTYRTAPSAKFKQKADPKRGIAMLVRIALGTGMRLSEVLGLTWYDIDTTAKTVTVNKQLSRKGEYQTTKTQAGIRVIPITDKLVQDLEAYKQYAKFTADTDPVIATVSGNPMRPITATAHVRHAAEACGLDGAHVHECRHIYASELIQRGAPVTTVSSLLGHANPSITMTVYAHVLDDHLDKAREYLV